MDLVLGQFIHKSKTKVLTASLIYCHLCLVVFNPSVMVITVTKVRSIVMVITITKVRSMVTVITMTGIVFYLP